jgi:hypothetical protein
MHADAGSTEATATVKAAAEAAHASIRGGRRRHCANKRNGRSGDHDLTPHDLASCPLLGTLSQSRSCMRKRALGADVQRHKSISKSFSDKEVSFVPVVSLVRVPFIMEAVARLFHPVHGVHVAVRRCRCRRVMVMRSAGS